MTRRPQLSRVGRAGGVLAPWLHVHDCACVTLTYGLGIGC